MSTLDITRRDGELVVTSQALAEGAGVEHRAVLQLVDNNRADFEGFGPLAFEMRKGQELPQGGFAKSTRVALLNEQQATLLMTYQRNTEQVRTFKKALVKAFYEMAREQVPQLPRDYASALRELASSVEARSALEAKVAADAPKVHFADAVAASPTTILIGELAKILRGNGVLIGQNRLFERLREEGYLIARRGSDRNMPTQKSMELGLFEIKESTRQQPDGSVLVSKTTKVTGRGQQYFIDRYRPSNGLDLDVAS
ncbi:phage regulatory protein/antirepressor Ant [Pseudoclavibacter sp. 8L]|uniref:phage regulatory protein/antirepressor Ant n=1 Tax=Pseudoclavibacter sp. 8L TaxID=2653162 RepID=UPI0012F365C9|nr:phage regulatory protein/antirepressor Ant [Pseudoclavibacter sp. 8L]VXB76564.1 Anti-repressor protein [Pseudoclavibacter sp. 8L]